MTQTQTRTAPDGRMVHHGHLDTTVGRCSVLGGRTMSLAGLRALGFDASARTGRHVRVGCSQCAALVINGVACHETGCPHEVHECRGCSSLVARGVRYCPDC